MINHKLINCLNFEQKKLIGKLTQIREVEKDSIIFLEYDPADYVYYIKEGLIKVYKTSLEGSEKIFTIYPENSFIALGVLFNEPHEYPASAAAISDGTVYALPRKELEQAIINDPKASKAWLGFMNNRLLRVQSMLSDEIFASGTERLKKLLRYFKQNTEYKEDNESLSYRIPINKQDMAELLSIRRETLSRILSSLKKEGVCVFKGKNVTIDNDWLYSDEGV
ncbi:Crp/Fnr family transcriptional regulator [Haloplasma contractile]|nr:Crp/Fnr family transcriptional regulator [Haloplasma contractile]